MRLLAPPRAQRDVECIVYVWVVAMVISMVLGPQGKASSEVLVAATTLHGIDAFALFVLVLGMLVALLVGISEVLSWWLWSGTFSHARKSI